MSMASPTATGGVQPILNGAVAQTFAGHVRRFPNWIVSTLSVASILVLWYLVGALGFVSASLLPRPLALGETFIRLAEHGYNGTSLWVEAYASLFRAVVGFAVGSVLGVIVGLIAGYNRVFGAMVSPVLKVLRPIPPIAFIPLSVLYFGLGNTGKIVLILFAAFNYTVVNAEAGVRAIPLGLRRAGASLGLSRWQEFVHIIIPGSLPGIFTGLRISMALSWAVVVAAELVGAQTGLGYMINSSALVLQLNTVYVGIACIGVIGLALDGVIFLSERKVVHWHGR